jgi:hypothetical protein
MFTLSTEDRLSSWADHRASLEDSSDPLIAAFDFWSHAPFIPYNRNIDPYNQNSWPTPWEIIAENKYDDFTRSLMLAYTIKYTQRFKNSVIQVHTLVDNSRSICYNVVCIDDKWAIDDTGVISKESIPESLLIENLIEVDEPR